MSSSISKSTITNLQVANPSACGRSIKLLLPIFTYPTRTSQKHPTSWPSPSASIILAVCQMFAMEIIQALDAAMVATAECGIWLERHVLRVPQRIRHFTEDSLNELRAELVSLFCTGFITFVIIALLFATASPSFIFWWRSVVNYWILGFFSLWFTMTLVCAGLPTPWFLLSKNATRMSPANLDCRRT